MAGVNFIEALETLKSMFPELDTVTLRDALDSKGGHMESAVEELLQISRRQRGVGGGGGGRMGGFGDDDGGGRGGGYSDEPPRHSSMGRGGHPSQIPRNPMRKMTRTPKKPKPSLTDLPPPHTHRRSQRPRRLLQRRAPARGGGFPLVVAHRRGRRATTRRVRQLQQRRRGHLHGSFLFIIFTYGQLD